MKQTVASTQQYLNFSEIKEGTVISKDGSLKAILMVSSLNFALKSEDEQKAIVYAYQNLLNSISHPIQIIIQSRKLDIDPYIEKLEKLEKEQNNELLKIQTREYRNFIKELVEMAEIMTKRFFVVVPYSPFETGGKKGTSQRLTNIIFPQRVVKYKEEQFRKYKEELQKRVDHIISQFSSMSLSAVALDTQALIELFYTIYNPKTSEQQELVGLEQLRVEME